MQFTFQLFDHCLAPNTMGDGTGCDNMTAIIISLQQLHGDNKKLPEKIKNDSDDALSSKRAGSPQTTEQDSKKFKSENHR